MQEQIEVVVANDGAGGLTQALEASELKFVSVVGCVADAFTEVLNSHPHLVLVGVTTTGNYGIELCRAIKACAETRGIPVVLVAEGTTKVQEKPAFTYGCLDYLSPKDNPEEFLPKMRSYCKLGKLEKSIRRMLKIVDSKGDKL